MPGPILRNRVVRYFGTPDVAEGSVNEPRERDEHGMHFNEKWTYRHPSRDPAGAAERTIYWRRYDYVGSMIRKTKDGEWQTDDSLPQGLEPSGA
jgi:hypothetical protein